MKYLRAIVAVALSLSLIASCTDTRERAEARTGVKESVAQLPHLGDFTTVKVMYQESRLSAFGQTCYYGGAIVIIGTSLPPLEALDAYETELLSLGWRPGEHRYPNSGGLLRGTHEEAVIATGYFPDLADDRDYLDAQSSYASVIVVRVNFMVPSNENC